MGNRYKSLLSRWVFLDTMGGEVASMVLNVYFAGFFSASYLWHINIQCTLVIQVRYISQDIQKNKCCNILLCWRQLVSAADTTIWGICLRTVYRLWILYICVIWKAPFYQKADLCVATTFHSLTWTNVPWRTWRRTHRDNERYHCNAFILSNKLSPVKSNWFVTA